MASSPSSTTAADLHGFHLSSRPGATQSEIKSMKLPSLQARPPSSIASASEGLDAKCALRDRARSAGRSTNYYWLEGCHTTERAEYRFLKHPEDACEEECLCRMTLICSWGFYPLST
ncbi:hypothetical protein GY45DRAFT_1122750 [Cubamyces sp. BRFM 1775]|nr:hypothetical protein GY45DRAFT_1122750 [Cubamyces sp. BRFM 1775]